MAHGERASWLVCRGQWKPAEKRMMRRVKRRVLGRALSAEIARMYDTRVCFDPEDARETFENEEDYECFLEWRDCEWSNEEFEEWLKNEACV